MYFHTPLLAKKNTIISMVSVSLLDVFTISLEFLQENILGTSLTVKVIAAIIFSINFIFFLKIFMSADTPECFSG